VRPNLCRPCIESINKNRPLKSKRARGLSLEEGPKQNAAICENQVDSAESKKTVHTVLLWLDSTRSRGERKIQRVRVACPSSNSRTRIECSNPCLFREGKMRGGLKVSLRTVKERGGATLAKKSFAGAALPQTKENTR